MNPEDLATQSRGALDFNAGRRDESQYNRTDRAGEVYRRGWQAARRLKESPPALAAPPVPPAEGQDQGVDRECSGTPEPGDFDHCPFGAVPEVSNLSVFDRETATGPGDVVPYKYAGHDLASKPDETARFVVSSQDVKLARGEDKPKEPIADEPGQLSFF